MPVPISQSPSRREPGSGSRPCQPKRAAPALVALLQPVAGPGWPVWRVDVGVVAQPQLDRVHAEPSASSSIAHSSANMPVDSPGAAHERRRHGVRPDQPVDALVVGAGVDLRRDAEGRLGPVVEGRGGRELVVAQRGEPAVAASRRASTRCSCSSRWPHGGEHLLPGERELDGPADHAGRPCAASVDVRPDHGLAAEAAADEVADDPDLRQRDAEQRGDGDAGWR